MYGHVGRGVMERPVVRLRFCEVPTLAPRDDPLRDLDRWPAPTRKAPASVDPNQGAFDIQEIHWTRAPILRDPARAVVVGGRQYTLYFSGDKLTQVAWKVGPNAYWITNTIDNALPNSFLLSLATSFEPVC